MNKRDKQLLVIIIALVLMLVLVIVGVIIAFGGNNREEEEKTKGNQITISGEEQQSNPEPGNNVPAEDPDILTEGTEIQTPCGTVFYPQEWEEFLKTESTEEKGGTKIRFFTAIEGKKDIPLFDLYFGIIEGSRFGTIKVNGKTTELYYKFYDPEFDGSWTEEEKNIVYSMQEGFNNVVAQLNADTRTTQAVEPSENKLEIETPYGKINFPGEWEEYLYTEVDSTGDYTVRFFADISGKRFSLFDISFGSESDLSVVKVKSKDGKEAWLNITMHEFVPTENTTYEEENIVYGMQEAFNDIVDDFAG